MACHARHLWVREGGGVVVGLIVGASQVTFHASLNKMYGTGKLSDNDKGVLPEYLAKCSIHPQNARGPE
jgi:hypothetical protein